MTDKNIIIILAGLVGFIWLPLICSILWKRPIVGAVVPFLFTGLEAIFINLPVLRLVTNIYPQDLIFVPMLIVGLIKGFYSRSGISKIALSLAILLVYSIVRGVILIGTDQIGESREDLYFFASILFFATSSISRIDKDRLVGYICNLGAVLILVAIFRWGATISGLAIASLWAETASQIGGGTPLRVLNASQALILAIVSILSIKFRSINRGSWWHRNAIYFTVPALLILQHRTIWIITIIALTILVLQDRQFRRKFYSYTLGIVTVIGIGVIIIGAKFVGIIKSSLEASSQSEDTLLWRLQGWQYFLSEGAPKSMHDILFGLPYGTGWERYQFGSFVDFPPHNFYIQEYLRIGLLGIIFLFLLYFYVLKIHSDRTIWGSIKNEMVAIQLIMFITYSSSPILGIILGLLAQDEPIENKFASEDDRMTSKSYSRILNFQSAGSPVLFTSDNSNTQ
ncbi:hypothetical protein [Deinococcus marmoris]|nr:hypothetical protein [Deinococcus marmoris]